MSPTFRAKSVYIYLNWAQEFEKALSDVLGVPAKLVHLGKRAVPGGDPMTINLQLSLLAGVNCLGGVPACHIVCGMRPESLLRWVAVIAGGVYQKVSGT